MKTSRHNIIRRALCLLPSLASLASIPSIQAQATAPTPADDTTPVISLNPYTINEKRTVP